MTTGVVHFFDEARFLSGAGGSAGGTVYFYYTGTTNIAPIYADKALTIPMANPVSVAVGAIVPQIFLDPTITYRRRIVFSDSTVFDVDPIAAAANVLTGDLISTANSKGAGLVGFSTSATYPANTVGSDLLSLNANVVRTAVTGNPVTVYVDFVNGTDAVGKGTSFGVNAFKTIQYAFTRLCSDYDHQGKVPTIQCAGPTAAGGSVGIQVHTSGLIVTDIDTPLTQNYSVPVGVQQVNLDLGGSTIQPATGGRCISIRGPRLYVLLSNCRLDGSVSAGDSIYVYGGGAEVGLGGGISWLGTNSSYSMMQASRGGRIHTRPNTTGYVVSGGAGYWAQSIIGGCIEIEGVQIQISGTPTFTQCFIQADKGIVSLFGSAFTGTNIVGKQYISQKEPGFIDINAQTGGQVVVINGSNVTSNDYTASPFSSGLATGFIPGTIAGTMGFLGGRVSDPGTPTITSGGGTSPLIQGTEPGFLIVLGSGNPTTVTVQLATTSNWLVANATPRNFGQLTNFTRAWTAPSGSTPGTLVLTWGAGSTSGAVIDVQCTG